MADEHRGIDRQPTSTPESGRSGTGRAARPSAQAFRQARDLLIAQRGPFALGVTLMLFSVASSVVMPFCAKYLFDEVLGRHRHDLVPYAVAAVLGASAIDAASSFALSQVLSVAAQRVVTELRASLHAHVIRLKVSDIEATTSGQLISRIMSDTDFVRNIVGTAFAQLIASVIKAALAFSILLWLNARLTLIVTALLILSTGVMIVGMRWLRPVYLERSRLNAAVMGRLGEAFNAIRVVKAYVAEEAEDARFGQSIQSIFDNFKRSATGIAALSSVTTVVLGVTSVTVLVLGVRSIEAGTMTTGDLIAYVFLFGQMSAPFSQMNTLSSQLTESLASLERISTLRALNREEDERPAGISVPKIRGDIAFEGVCFGYHEDRLVLKDLTFAAPAGSSVAVVGRSGSGKTTLASLLMAFYRPRQGTITIDGIDLQSMNLREYRRHLGVVLQDNILFDGTIAENIAFSNPGATVAEIRRASRIAHCDEFVDALPAGFATVCGERGVKLSAGQRQRIAIARALLADPRILILDEATSNLDLASEELVRDALRHLQQDRTTLVIAHRLVSTRDADRILVLGGGRIVESGTHSSLLSQGGLYRALYEKQSYDDLHVA